MTQMNVEKAKEKLTQKARTLLENGSVFVYYMDGLFALATTAGSVGKMGYRTLCYIGTDKLPLKEMYRKLTEYRDNH